MLKLILVLSVVLVSPLLATKESVNKPFIQSPQMALTAPATYDYSYLYNSGTFRFYNKSVYTVPLYARVGTTPFPTFYTTITADSNAPFDIYLSFNQATETGYWTNLSGPIYTPKKDHILMSDGTDSTHATIGLTNNTVYDYLLYTDFTGTAGSDQFVSYNYKIGTNDIYTYTQYVRLDTTALQRFYIPAMTTTEIKGELADYNLCFSAFYLDQLNVSTAYSNGYSVGNSMGYSEGYGSGNSDGYGSGYAEGNSDGYGLGYMDGQDSGYSIGYSSGYNVGYEDGYDDGIVVYNSEAYDEGYDDGMSDTFMSGFKDWIVPAIIIVLFLGGFISIWAMKKRNEA